MRRKLISLMSCATVLLGGLATAGSALAQATIIDPNFSVCALGTTNVTSCGPTDPQRIASDGVSAGIIGGAGAGPLNPFLLLIAVPDLPSPPLTPNVPTIGSGSNSLLSHTLTVNYATTPLYSTRSGSLTNGFLGEFTSGNLYTFAGLVGDPNASANFTNLTGSLEQSTLGGTTPTSFAVYELTVTDNSLATGANLGTADIYNIHLGLDIGDFVFAYGIETFPVPTHGEDHVYATPFTTAGLVTTSGGTETSGPNVPEPGTLALLSLGMLGIRYSGRRSNTRKTD